MIFQLLPALCVITVILVGFLVVRGFRPLKSQNVEISRHDRDLVDFACSIEGLDTQQQKYIESIGRQLIAYSIGATNSLLMYQALGVLTISANYLAVGITGTGYIPCESAKSLSFVVNLVAALLLGMTQLFLFDKTAQSSQMSSAKIRWELLQFIGKSDGYMGLGLQDRYNLFAISTDKLIDEQIRHVSQATFDSKKVADQSKDDSERFR